MKLTQNEFETLLQEHDAYHVELLERCRQGDRKAFNQFMQRFQDTVYAHVLHMVGKTGALAVTRDVFVKAFTSFKQLQHSESAQAWLLKIAEQQIRTAGKKQQSDTHKEQDEHSEAADDLLLAYMDGELEQPEIALVEQRLEDDAEYRREYERLQQVDNMLRILSRPSSAPAELRVLVNAKLDEKSLWQKILAAIEIFRHGTPERRLIQNTHIALAVGSIAICVIGAWLYQYQQLQIHRMTIQELQHYTQRSASQPGSRSGQQSAQAYPSTIQGLYPVPTSVVILTGQLEPQHISFDDARAIAVVTSELVEGQEPLWIPGGVEAVMVHLQQRIAPLFWEQKYERIYRQDGFLIREISFDLPENAVAEFWFALQRFNRKADSAIDTPEISTVPIKISIMDKQ
jgi:DNA-directed RNA polymerase specialized sigma24 family protein